MKRAAHVAVAAMAAVLVLAAAACSAAPGDDGVATLGGSGEEAAASPTPSEDPEQALVEFAECMREQGVEVETSFEGGGEDVGIRIEADPENVGRGDLEEADAACRHLLPEGLFEPPSAAEQEEMFERALRFAECMREHGIDFPDPRQAEGGGILFGPGENTDPEDPALREAEEECRGIMEAGREARGIAP
jgi:hypothetical protein